VNRGKQLVKNTIILAFGSILPKLLAIISLPIVTGNLTKLEYGIYDLIGVIESLILPCITLQIPLAAFRYLVDYRNKELEISMIISSTFFFSVIVSIPSFLAGMLFLKEYDDYKILICLIVFWYLFVNVFQQFVRGLNDNKCYSKSTILYSCINVIFLVLLVKKLELGLYGALLSILISYLVQITFLLLEGKIYRYVLIKNVSFSKIREMIKYSTPLVPNSISIWLMNLSDRIILSLFCGLEVSAVYAIANKIPSLFNVAQSTFTMAWQENASMVSSDNDVSDYYKEVFDTSLRLMIGIMAILISTSPFLFRILIKGTYEAAYNQIPILLVASFFAGVSAFMGGIYVACKKTKKIGISTMISAFINVLINLLLVKHIGIYAASISTLVSYVILVIYRMIDISNSLFIKFEWLVYIQYVTVLILMCLVSFINHKGLDVLNILFAFSYAVILNKKIVLRMFQSLIFNVRK